MLARFSRQGFTRVAAKIDRWLGGAVHESPTAGKAQKGLKSKSLKSALSHAIFAPVPDQTDIEFLCKLAAEIPAEQIRDGLSLIANGGAVDPRTAAVELPRARLIALALAPGSPKILGIGVIKGRRPTYTSHVAARSGFSLAPNTHELGYVVVEESKRRLGISHRITSLLLSRFQERPLFATTSHEGMKRTLRRAGFTQEGHEWPGKFGALSLWIKASP